MVSNGIKIKGLKMKIKNTIPKHYDKLVSNVPCVPGQWDKLEDHYYLKDKHVAIVKKDNKQQNGRAHD
jgi:hypothetical protein